MDIERVPLTPFYPPVDPMQVTGGDDMDMGIEGEQLPVEAAVATVVSMLEPWAPFQEEAKLVSTDGEAKAILVAEWAPLDEQAAAFLFAEWAILDEEAAAAVIHEWSATTLHDVFSAETLLFTNSPLYAPGFSLSRTKQTCCVISCSRA